MKLTLNPEILHAAYAYLAETQPFSRWNMPPAEDIRFRVSRARALYGCCEYEAGKICIRISDAMHGTTDTLIRTMAHEMVHVYHFSTGMDTKNEHNPAWWKLAKKVCAIHGFDPKAF